MVRFLIVVGLLVLPVAAQDAVPLALAWERRAALETLLEKRKSTNDALVAAIADVEDAYRRLEKAPAERNAFLEAAEDSLLEALRLKQVQRDSKVNDRHPVQMRAARALGHVRPRAAKAMRRALELRVFRADYEPYVTFYEAAFMTLVRLDPDGTIPWLLEKVMNAELEADAVNRTIAGFHAIRRARGVDGNRRRRAVKRILSLWQSFSYHVEFDYYDVASFRGVQKQYKRISSAGRYWILMKPVVMGALRSLGIDPRTGLPPFDLDTRQEIETVSRFKVWFGQNKRPGHAPWLPAAANVAPPPRDRVVYVRPAPPVWRKFGIPWTTWWRRNRVLAPRAARTTAPERPKALDDLREKTLPTLLAKALADPSPEVRAAAAMTSGKLATKGAAVLLRERLDRDAAEQVREAAMLGLLLLRDPALAAFLRSAAGAPDENPRVRAYAVLALGLLKDRDFLVALLADESARSDEVRRDLQACAVRALAFCGSPEDAETLAAWMRDPKRPGEVRGHAGTTLRAIGSSKQRDAILKALRPTRVRREEQIAQCAAAIAARAAVLSDDGPGLKAIRTRLARSEGRFAGTRTRLALSLGAIGGRDAERILIKEYKSFRNQSTRYAERGHFLLALGLIRTGGAIEFLRGEFQELDHEFDAAACALALAMAGDRTSANAIRQRLHASSGEFVPHGMIALALLGEKTASHTFRNILERRGDAQARAEGGRALAMLLGGGARDDLLRLWERCGTAEELDHCADAFALTQSTDVVATLLTIYRGTALRTPEERAFALIALGRLADPTRNELLAGFARDFHPYAGAPTLLLLARQKDVPFLY